MQMIGSNDWEQRTELLIGEKNIEKLHRSRVLVVGLGGVGACTAEMLCRAGVGQMTIVDGDTYQLTNLNRQLSSFTGNIGKKKAIVIAKKLIDINPGIILKVVDEYIKKEDMQNLFTDSFDYVIDAIDTLSPKIYLIYNSLKKSIPLVSSMGSGGKSNPALVKIADISDSHTCNLARILRKRLHKLGIYDGFKVVFSSEVTDRETIEITEEEINKRTVVGTISYMPVVFGCYCASVVIRNLLDNKV
jgi:tRNA A37 threonylcarbamoyladenosine dehydratase